MILLLPFWLNLLPDRLEPNIEYEMTIVALFRPPAQSKIPPIQDESSPSSSSTPTLPPNYTKYWKKGGKSLLLQSLPVKLFASYLLTQVWKMTKRWKERDIHSDKKRNESCLFNSSSCPSSSFLTPSSFTDSVWTSFLSSSFHFSFIPDLVH